MRIVEVPEERRFLLSSTSKGNQIKWFYNNEYLKADSMGYEGLAEAFVSELESRIVNPDFSYVDYQMCIIREISSDSGDSMDYTGCCSKNMLNDGEFLLSVYRMLETRYSKNKVNSILNGSKRLWKRYNRFRAWHGGGSYFHKVFGFQNISCSYVDVGCPCFK